MRLITPTDDTVSCGLQTKDRGFLLISDGGYNYGSNNMLPLTALTYVTTT